MKDVAKFIFEAGSLKRIRRAWFKAEGVPSPESVADHSFRVILIGYILAKMENADVDKVMKICLFHDIPEARIGDLDKVAQKYISKDDAELEAFHDQLERLPDKVKDGTHELLKEMTDRKTKEAIVARDADILELTFQAKEYADAGHSGCLYWIEKNKPLFRTESAKKLSDELLKMNSTEWWKGLENLR